MRLVVTFHVTADAMAAEEVCRRRKIPGRLVPVPRALSASCGLSWSAPLEAEERIREAFAGEGIAAEGYYETEMLV